LRSVDEFIAKGQLASPPKENAYELLRQVTEMAPDYPESQKRVVALAGKFKEQSGEALAKKDYDTAEARLEQARLVNPKDPEVASLKEKVANARKGAERAQAMAELVAKADAAESAGKIFGAEGAYALLQRAQQSAPDDAAVKQRLDALVQRALTPARDALAAGKLADAQARVNELESFLANQGAWKALHDDLEKAAAAASQKQRIDAMFAKFDAELKADHINAPSGANALETLAQLGAAAPNDPELARRKDQLAARLLEQADAALRAGRGDAAANMALDVKPGLSAALALKQNVEKTLDTNRLKLNDALASAQRAIAAQHFLEPANDNAKALAEAVLKLDPNNAAAKTLLTELPRRIADAARTRAQGGDLAAASALVEGARKVYPADAALATLGTDLGRQLAEAKARDERSKRYERLAQLIASKPLSAENSAAASREIVALLTANKSDVDAATAKKRLFAALEEAVAAAQSNADLDQFSAALNPVRQQFATDAETLALVGRLDSARRRVAEEEKARLAASSGELVLNAYPWGKVESVTDSSGKPVALPADATTPLKLTLPAGVYQVTFRHPQVTRTAKQVAQVQAKGSVTVATTFNGISTRDYLKRAGW
jgi:hypothetical protein